LAEVVPVIDPGSSSTKLAIWTREKALWEVEIRHPYEELSKYDKVTEQYEYRVGAIRETVFEQLKGHTAVAVAGRGAPLKPLEHGTYFVGEKLLQDLHSCRYANHASNLGGIMASNLAEKLGVRAYIVDPITIDNFIPQARVSGFPGIVRKCRSHALNIKAQAREVAASLGKSIDTCDFIVAHMGSGISVCALHQGLVIDVNDALLGMGPFSPDRSGALPIGELVHLCYSGRFTEQEMTKKLSKGSGLVAYLGTADLIEVQKMIESGNAKAEEILRAMAYQVAKEIGMMSATLKGSVDGIILTGGMAKSRLLLDEIEQYIRHLGEVFERPGELEMKALAEGVFRVVDGVESPKEYN